MLTLLHIVLAMTAASAQSAASTTRMVTLSDGGAVASFMPRTGQAALSARLPGYPGAPAPVTMGDQLTTSGVPMNIQVFTTPDDPRKVLGFYEHVMSDLHLPLMGDGEFLIRFPYPSITAFDDQDGVQFSVIAMRDKSNVRTTVFLALADIQTLESNVQAVARNQYHGLPPYPNGEEPRSMTASDGERRAVVVSFGTDDPPRDVFSFYRSALRKQGYQSAQDPSPDVMVMTSVSGQWRLRVGRDATLNKTVVMATWIAGAPDSATIAEGSP